MRMLWRALLALALLCSVARAQPVRAGWRPPAGCTSGQVISWNGSAWVCGTVASFTTANTIPKGNGSGLVASSLSDAGAGTIEQAQVAGLAAYMLGDSVALTGASDVGYRALTFSDGNVYFDHKLGSGGKINYRTGHNTETGDTRTWMDVTGSTGLVSMPAGLSVGDAAGDVFDHNGDLAKFGSVDGATFVYGEQVNFSHSVDADAVGYISWRGYANGTTRFRDTVIGNGKTATVALFTGSDKSLAVVGNLSTAGNLTAGDGPTDTTTINGNFVLNGNELHFEDDTVGVATGYINYYGTAGGTTQYRNLVISNGRGTAIATFTGGVDGGNVTTTGDWTLGDAANDTATINGVLSVQEFRGAVTSPASIGAHQNDYAGCATTTKTCRITSSAAYDITGMTGGASGREATLCNIGSFDITLKHADALSAAANRFRLLSALPHRLSPYGCVDFIYDATSALWRQKGDTFVSSLIVSSGLTVESSGLTANSLVVTGTINSYTQTGQQANQDVTNAGLTDSNTLTIATAAGKIYAIDGFIIAGGNNTTGDYTFDFAVAAGTMDCTGTQQSVTAGDAIQTTTIIATAAADTADTVVGTRADASLPIAIRITLACKVTDATTLKYRFGNAAPLAGRTSRTMTGSYLKWAVLN
jgi:hypothetical protein